MVDVHAICCKPVFKLGRDRCGFFVRIFWRPRVWQDDWHPTQWDGYCEGLNRVILEVFVTDTWQRALAACERDFP